MQSVIPVQKVALANLPTKIHPLLRVSAWLGGPEIWIKRDDLTGCALSGNKVRKLEYLAYDATKKKSDVLITCGGIQSNHARATAAVAAQLGMKCHLVLSGHEEDLPDGNLFLDMLFGAQVAFVEGADLSRLDHAMEEVAQKYKAKGLNPYIVPLGASNALGALGYVETAAEIAMQAGELNVRFDHVVLPCGSAGTLAGLATGFSHLESKTQIWGISVSFEKQWIKDKVSELTQEIKKFFLPQLNTPLENFHVLDSYIGEGYGKTTPQQLKMIHEIASMEGIVLDPVYTGKAFWGLKEEIQRGTFKKGHKVLFLHTGGIFGLFARRYKEMLTSDILRPENSQTNTP
jgi:D-cysteine desulfhydrase